MHECLNKDLASFVMAYNCAKKLKSLKELTPYEYIVGIWEEEPEQFTVNLIRFIMGTDT